MNSSEVKRAKKFAKECLTYSGKLIEFIRKMGFYEQYEDFQIDIINDIDNMLKSSEPYAVKHAVNGCKGCGKSSLVCLLSLCLLLIEDNVKIIYFSGKEDQSKNIFIPDVKNLLSQTKYGKFIAQILQFTDKSIKNTFTGQECKIGTFSKTKDGGSIDTGGMHGVGVLFNIYDEAPSIPTSVFNQTSGIVASGKPIMLMLGNPEFEKPTYYSDVFLKDSRGWKTHNISFLELKCKTPQQINDMLDVYPAGTENYKKYVLGQFIVPKSTSLINYQDLYNIIKILDKPSLSISHLEDGTRYTDQTYIGIDVSSGNGLADTVITARTGNTIEIVTVDPHIPLNNLCNFILLMNEKYQSKLHFIIDGDGIGNSIKPMLNTDERGKRVLITNFHNVQRKHVHYCYYSKRCELYGQFSNYLDQTVHLINTDNNHLLEHYKYKMIIPADASIEIMEKIKNQCGATVFTVEGGRKQLIPKKSLPFSTDILDAVCFTFYYKQKTNLY